jgi:hypothetical protein
LAVVIILRIGSHIHQEDRKAGESTRQNKEIKGNDPRKKRSQPVLERVAESEVGKRAEEGDACAERNDTAYSRPARDKQQEATADQRKEGGMLLTRKDNGALPGHYYISFLTDPL